MRYIEYLAAIAANLRLVISSTKLPAGLLGRKAGILSYGPMESWEVNFLDVPCMYNCTCFLNVGL